MKKYVIAIDQGTTSTRVVLVDQAGDIIYKEQMPVYQTIDGQAVLQNADTLYESVETLLKRVISRYEIDPNEVAAIGITNQRETTILWDKETGLPIYHAISWQSKQTSSITDQWKKDGLEPIVTEKTGLKINPYFSASKIVYIMKKTNYDVKKIMFGTVDSYLLYRLTKKKVHLTDVTNASRTMLYNIHTGSWDQTLLEYFEIPIEILPDVVANDTLFGYYEYQGVQIPIHGMIGDQQSALLGHQCFDIGDTKSTYGTGCFMLMNTGSTAYVSKKGLLTTIAWEMKQETTYALEGSVFMGGASVQWIRDQLAVIKNASETEQLAKESKDNTLYIVPAFVGLGTPYWDSEAKGAMLGLKANTTKADIAKATLNAIAYQVEDVLRVMEEETHIVIKSLAIDGGASQNQYLVQFQSNISQKQITQSAEHEITALGAAYLAGVASSFWENFTVIQRNRKIKEIFNPMMTSERAELLYKGWQLAIKATQIFKIEEEK